MIFNPITYVYFKERHLGELTVTENGEYLPTSVGADAISKVTVNVPVPKLATPTITQHGNFLIVNNDNGCWGDAIDYYKDNAAFITTSTNYLNLDKVFSLYESGNFKVVIRYANSEFEQSNYSNTIGCQRQNYTTCQLEFLDDHFRVIGVEDPEIEEVIIPPLAELELKLFPITEIAENAFKDLKKLITVSGESIEVIYDRAFSGCSMLTYAAFPSLKRIIGNEVFAETMIRELNLSSLETLTGNLLKCNTESVKLTMPTSNMYYSIPSYLFHETKIQNLTLPENIKRIDEFAFKGATLNILNILSKEIVLSPNAFTDSPFMSNNGIVFIDYSCLEKVISENTNLPLLGCVINTDSDITIKGIQTINGKNYAIQLFYSASDAFELYNPINNQGEDYASYGGQQYYARITEVV